MKTNLLTLGALAVALAIPLGASAQQMQQSQPPAGRAHAGHGVPSEAKLQHRWAKRFGQLNLSGDQQQRVQSIIDQYAQAHPEGSAPDHNAARELRRQLMGVLTSDQQSQYREQMKSRRAQHQRRGEQSGEGQYQQGGYQQGPGPQGYPQGAPDQQYQQGPPDQRYQQGPPDQQYPQGPPDQQYQQGPPPG